MLINLSNHPNWEGLQLETANKLYGTVKDMTFPAIDPQWTDQRVEEEARVYLQKCLDLLAESPHEKNAVHLMGESFFCFLLTQMLLKAGCACILSITKRREEVEGKRPSFIFCGFRHFKWV